MTDFAERVAGLSPAQRALLALKQTQSRLEALERSRSEPIAIVGQACRFPGASDPEQFWRLLADGKCSISEVPSSRWDLGAYYDPDPEVPGKMYTRWGGFLDHVDQFDAEFFGITPRETVSMDPQQRLLLETSWRAIEDAGLTLHKLNCSPTGVFIGISTCDYRQLDDRWRDSTRIDPYLGTGNVFSVAAGRLSYHLGLQGPNLAVDTACSSSLTCLHLACASLRAGECNAALVGGVNLILWPEGTVYFCKLHALAPDGRCKTFDAAADGYVRGEGCSVIVLKRLSDAIADRDRVLAVIRGSAVNHDGPSMGLTAPNGAAQEAVIRAAIRNAGCTPADIQFVEAHGTGTALGDPIEVRALAAALSGKRDERCWLGSVKANVGHLEAAAGLAGLLKVILAFQHDRIPQQIHVQQPTPHIPWDDVPLQLPLSAVDWPRSNRPRIAGLSSFGLSGTNAHIILEEPPQTARSAKVDRPIHILALSAKDGPTLETYVDSVRGKLSEPDQPAFADFCFSTNTGRSTFAHRLAIVAENAAEAKACLEGAAAKHPKRSGVVRDNPKIAFLFSGQGSQYAGMGRELFHSQPVFRDELSRCDKILEPLLGRSILSVMHAPSADSLLTQTELCQPALFAIEYALARLWASWGVTPDALLGHSLGEYVAACIGGCFSLEDALRLVARRGQLVQSLAADEGAMAAAFCNEATLRDLIEAERLPLDIAALNSSTNSVVSGHRVAVRQAIAAAQRRGIEARPLPVSHAFHSRLLDSVLPQFEEFAGSVTSLPPRIPLVSNLTCELMDRAPDARYWRDHLRQPVRFRGGVQALLDQGCDVFLEIGPGSVLTSLARQTAPEGSSLVSSLRPGAGEWAQMLTALQELFVRGVNIDFSALDAPFERRRVSVPGHPFRRERFWLDEGSCHQPDTIHAKATNHSLLGKPVRAAIEDKVFETDLTAHSLPFVRDHRLFEEMLLPAAGFLEWALAGARAIGAEFPLELSEVSFASKLQLEEQDARVAQICISPEKRFRILSLSKTQDWTLHAQGNVRGGATENSPVIDFGERPDSAHLSSNAFYERLHRDGVDYGASLRGVQEVWHRANQGFARIELPQAAITNGDSYYLHPALLDSCFQLLSVIGVEAYCEPGELFVPVQCRRFWFSGKAVTRVVCHAQLEVPTHSRAEFLSANLRLVDEDGTVVAEVAGLRMQRIARTKAGIHHDSVPDWLLQVEWRPHQMAASLPTLTKTLERLRELVQSQESDPSLRLAPDFRRDLDVLCGMYVQQALRKIENSNGTRIAPERRRLLSRLQEIAREDAGFQAPYAGVQAPSQDAAEQIASLVDRFPEWRGELELLERCGQRLADVLRGECDPLQLLFPAGSIELTAAIYEHSPVTRFGNTAVVSALREASAEVEPGRRLRILEVGAGSGGTTASIFEHLPQDSFDYCFTDVSPLFLDRARRRFSKHRNIRFQTFDIEKSPGSQGFAAESFDIVLAANVIHATADLRQTCAHLREVLVADGRLMLLEGTGKQRWADLVFGLTDGWWRFCDAPVRENYPLLSPSAWESFLSSQGFSDVNVVAPPRQSAAAAVEQAIILASKRAGQFQHQRWLVLADAAGVGAEIARRLDASGANCTVVQAGREFQRLSDGTWIVDAASAEDLSRLKLESLPQGEKWHGAVHLWGLDPENEVTDPVHGCASVLHLVQMLVNQAALGDGKLRVITRGAQFVGSSDDSPEAGLSQSLVWGLAKAIAIEHPELGCVRIDLDPSTPERAVQSVWYELGHRDEDQIAWRGGQRHVARLTRWPNATGATEQRTTLAVPTEPSRLEIASRGILESLHWKPLPVPKPGRGEVLIRVTATGLNFRDVLNAVGAYPGNAGALGGECAGVIEAVGEGVRQWTCGERVVALADAAFSNFVLASSELVARLPDELTDAQGATLPAAYLTVALGLGQHAQLRRGDRVLIHAATGGVGLAAVHWARQVGAEIFATAGSTAKRAFLRRLGIRHVFDSRSLNFTQDILAATNQQGVDVVLNSLSGDFIEAGVQALAADGRFVEIGRKDVWSEERFHQARPGARYYVVSLDESAKNRPESVGIELRRVMEAISEGRLAPLPVTTYSPGEAVVAFRRMSHAKHLGKIAVDYSSRGSVAIRSDATYLITGGLGGLGLLTAKWLAENGARHLLLVGRSAPSSEAAAQIAALQARGIHVHVRSVDVSQAEQVAALWHDAGHDYPVIRGVLHLAGALDNGVLLQQNWSRFRNVLAAKVSGAWHLHNCTKNSDNDFFVVYSSVASLLGSPGQGNHAAANAFLDALAQYRRSQGLPGLSINWGAWSEIGAAAQYVTSGNLHGLGSISPADGLRALRTVWNSDRAQVGVVPVDWPAFIRLLPARTPFLEEIMRDTSETSLRAEDTIASSSPVWRQSSARHQRSELADAVRAQVGHVLGLAPARLRDGRRPLHDLGLDSLMAVELRNRLSQLLGVSLPASLLYDYPTLDALVTHLSDVVQLTNDSEKVQPVPARSAVPLTEPIAVVGMGCRFPGGATNPERYWELLRRGGDAIVEVPSTRWDADAIYDPDPSTSGKTNTRWGGFLDEVDTFDPALFGISPREAVSMDPQQRLFLEVAWEALESAGIAPDRLQGTPTGVFLGMCGNDYAQLCAQNDGVDPYLSTGNAASVATGRLSYLLGLQGPSMTVDTACSSSLVALHLACQSLRLAECSLALAGGVQLLLTPGSTLALSRLGFMAPDGHCKTFDASADGFVRGEGCGVVVLRRLSDAQAAGDRVLAIIRGSAVNQDGRSGGLTAPNGPAQENLLRAALAAAGVQASDVGYVETHGTGTSLGDPIEVQALAHVMSEGRDERQPLRLGAVKANLGHLEAAAGVAGLIKAVLVLNHEEIPPQIHFHTPSPHIAWDPLMVVSSSATKWPRGEKPRIGGVSSFGFSGTNAHVVLQEPPPPEPLPSPEGRERPWHVLTLSAHSEAAAQARLDQHLRFLDEHPDVSLPNMCYTANVGRAHGIYRLAVIAESSEGLRRALLQSQTEAGFHHAEAPPQIAFAFTEVATVDVPGVLELYQSQSAFRQSLDRIAGVIRKRTSQKSAITPDQSLKDLLGGSLGGLMQGYALVELLRSWGIVASQAAGKGWSRGLAEFVAGKGSVEDIVEWALRLPIPEPEPVETIPASQLDAVFVTVGSDDGAPKNAHADWKQLAALAAHLYELGVEIDWKAFDCDYVRRKENLPTYPFQRRRYWAGSDPVVEGSEWTYRVEWQPSIENGPSIRSGTWLVLCDEQTKSMQFIEKLRRQGQACDVVSQQNASSHSQLRDLLAAQPWIVVVCCFFSHPSQDDHAELSDEWTRSGPFLARVVQAMASISSPPAAPRCWVVTQGATTVEDGDTPVLHHSPLWGMARTVSLEHPEWWGGLIDIDSADADFQHFELPDLVNERQDQIAYRGGRRLTPQLVRMVVSPQQRMRIRRDANYLITGGFGALGIEVAQWLAERGATRLTLLGRRGWEETPQSRRRVVEKLRAQGIQVDVYSADVTDFNRLESIFAEMARGPNPLRGIIHTAGRVQAQPVAGLTDDDYLSIASAKIQGGWNLHRLSLSYDLDFFVLFSSAASVWGSQGSGAYSAGNHFLDTLAHYRRSRGLPSMTVNWARLSERGMLEADEASALQRMGVRSVPVRSGLDIMDYLAGSGLAQAVVANIDWNLFHKVYSARRERPLLETLARECSNEQLPANPGEARARLQSLPGSQRVPYLATRIKEHLGEVLKLESVQSIGLHQGFFSLGMDSLMAVDLKERLQRALDHPISVSTLFTYSTTQSLSEHLVAGMFDGNGEADSGEADSNVPSQEPPQGVAGLLDFVEDLPEQEVEKLLRHKLAKGAS